MSNIYLAVSWNRQKKIYDGLLSGFCILYLLVFTLATVLFNPEYTFETILLRSTSTLSLLLLHYILSVGPMCRLNPVFLPLLYNRRHAGVAMFLLALVHGLFGLKQFHSQGNTSAFVSLFTSNTDYGSFVDFPFQVLGFSALLILFLMAATSHDFWLHNLTPKTWKTLHMLVYLAYFLLVMHVMLGVIQYETNPFFFVIMLTGAAGLTALHLAAAWKEMKKDCFNEQTQTSGFVRIGPPDKIASDCAITVSLGKERIAIFKTGGKIYAVSSVCKHQQGPLGEGRVIDGCITCPWHGYQYLPKNGQSPPPFTEKIRTYELKMEAGEIWINPDALPEGTETTGIEVFATSFSKNASYEK